MYKTDLKPPVDTTENQSDLDETMIRSNGWQYWLYAVADSQTNKSLHIPLYAAKTAPLAKMFLCKLCQKHDVHKSGALVQSSERRSLSG